MLVFLYLAASQPCGRSYRLGLGCVLHPKLASMMVLLHATVLNKRAPRKRGAFLRWAILGLRCSRLLSESQWVLREGPARKTAHHGRA
jgi:hypothetical protein